MHRLCLPRVSNLSTSFPELSLRHLTTQISSLILSSMSVIIYDHLWFYNISTEWGSRIVSVFMIVNTDMISNHPLYLLFNLVYGIEILILVVLLLFTWILIVAVHRSKTVHFNLRRLFKWYMIQCYLSFVSRFVILLYQWKLVQFTGTVYDIPFLVCSFLRFYVLQQSTLFIPGIFVERICATIYISDYEKTPRKHISLSILLAQMFFSSSGSLAMMSVVYYNYSIILIVYIPLGCTVVMSTCTGLLLLYRRNQRLLDAMNSHKVDGIRHLNMRYQLNENVKTMKSIYYQVIVFSSINGLTEIFSFPAFAFLNSNTFAYQFLLALSELGIAVLFLATNVCTLAAFPSWRDHFIRVIYGWFGVRPKERSNRIHGASLKHQRDAYFEIFNKAWSYIEKPH